ncbi:MAG: hypothetical protein AAF771_05785 [Pseudomonadota bacterium]
MLAFFSSWLNTDAAKDFASEGVGFFPASTFDANEETFEEDCFLGMSSPRFAC